MTQVPPIGGDGAPDERLEPPTPPGPPPFPGGPPGAGPTSQAPPPPPTPPPGSGPPPGFMPPPTPGYGPMPYGSPAVGPPGFGAAPSLAGYGARLGGWVIDFVIIVVVDLIVVIPLRLVRAQHVVVRGTHAFRYHFGFGGLVLTGIIVVLYGGVLCGTPRGQTIGMMASGTRVVSADGNEPIGYPRAFGRAAFEYLMAVVFFLPWVLDVLFPLWDPRNQTLHDKVTHAVVVNT
jgi:uncharacterized RDD family membrane protein YckC